LGELALNLIVLIIVYGSQDNKAFISGKPVEHPLTIEDNPGGDLGVRESRPPDFGIGSWGLY